MPTYANLLGGLVDDAPLLIGATTLTSTALEDAPEIVAPDFMWITLDPDGDAGAPEIVKVTAHTALATSATIERAQQSTTARQHLQNTVWRHDVTKSDLDGLSALFPVGAGCEFYGTSLPTGFLWADGSEVSRTTYAALFAAISTTWGAGNGSTTFNVPDRRERVGVGVGGAGAHASLGGTGGSADAIVVSHSHTGPSHTHTGPSHTHTGPSHTHTFSDTATTGSSGAHTHDYTDRTIASGVSFTNTGTGLATTSVADTTTSDGAHTHSVTVSGTTGAGGTGATGASGTGATGASGTGATSTTGSSGTGANLQPYVNCHYIIKY